MRAGQKYFLILALAIIPTLSACPNPSPPEDLVGRKDVSIAKALEDIGKGFRSLSSELDGAVLGVVPCRILMVLVVKASATEDNTLAIGVSESPITIVGKSVQTDEESGSGSPGLGVIGTREEMATANRDNTITIELYNPGCLPKDTLGFEKPEEVGAAMRGMLVTHDMVRRHPNLLGKLSDRVSEERRIEQETLEQILEVKEPALPSM